MKINEEAVRYADRNSSVYKYNLNAFITGAKWALDQAKALAEACETVVKGYEGDGMEGMGARDFVFYEACKTALSVNGNFREDESGRRIGTTTRLADKYVQDFFRDGFVWCKDHYPSKYADSHLLKIVANRLMVEHGIAIFRSKRPDRPGSATIDEVNFTITLNK